MTINDKLTSIQKKTNQWSYECFESSFINKILLKILCFKNNNLKENLALAKFFNILLLSLVSILFIALVLPSFSSDRFGVGIIIVGLIPVFFLGILFRSSKNIQFSFQDFLILSLLLVFTISAFSSYFFKESLVGLSKYLLYFSLYFIFKYILGVNSTKSFMYLWSFLIFLSFSVAMFGIYQYFAGVQPLATWEDSSLEKIHTRIYSTLGNPNLLAGYLLFFLPVTLFLPFEFKLSSKTKTLFLTAFSVIFSAIIFTGSRGAYISLVGILFFSSLVFVNSIPRKQLIDKIFKNKVLFVSAVAVGFYVASHLFPQFVERFSTIFAFREHSSNNFRMNVWLSSIEMFFDNFLFGVGPGNKAFRLAYGLYMKSGFDALSPYNILLEIALDSGIIGLIIFIFIFLNAFIKLHITFWQSKSLLALSFALSLAGVFIHGMTDTVFFRPQVFILFLFLLASIEKIDIIIKSRGKLSIEN